MWQRGAVQVFDLGCEPSGQPDSKPKSLLLKQEVEVQELRAPRPHGRLDVSIFAQCKC